MADFVPTEEFIIMANLQNIRFTRAWIDCEFALYQKLCRNREALLDLQITTINAMIRKERRASRASLTNKIH